MPMRMWLSSTKQKRNLLLLSSTTIILLIFSYSVDFSYSQREQPTDPTDSFLYFLNSPFITAVFSTIVVSIIAFFAGKFRNVSKKLQAIPKLEEDNLEIKKKVKEVDAKLDKTSMEVKTQLEKIEERMDKRFDTINDVQRSIEHSMNEKFVNLLISLRNFSASDVSNNSPIGNTQKKYKGD